MPENKSHLLPQLPEGVSKELGERKVAAAKAVLAEHGLMVVSTKGVEGLLMTTLSTRKSIDDELAEHKDIDISTFSGSMAVNMAQETILTLIALSNGLDDLDGLKKKFGIEDSAVEVK